MIPLVDTLNVINEDTDRRLHERARHEVPASPVSTQKIMPHVHLHSARRQRLRFSVIISTFYDQYTLTTPHLLPPHAFSNILSTSNNNNLDSNLIIALISKGAGNAVIISKGADNILSTSNNNLDRSLITASISKGAGDAVIFSKGAGNVPFVLSLAKSHEPKVFNLILQLFRIRLCGI